MTQLLLHLPDDLVRRFRRAVAARQRSMFVQRLLETALPPESGDDDPLYQAALLVENDAALAAEMAEWEQATLGDGLAAGASEGEASG
ncbi:MAG TPA: hypothetical protein VFQ82_13600 [Stellaceae bacterium]|jgi:hypothetical protein|nr:hypothetical protein [Stellaceae bacterium]